MRPRLLFLLKYFLFWMLAFWVLKLVFLVYHHEIYFQYSFSELLKIFIYGSKLDLSFVGYICLLPLLLLVFSSFFAANTFCKIIRYYTWVVFTMVIIVSFVDLEIFKWWGFRIDSSLFKYLKTPKEAMANVWVAPVFLLLVIMGASYFLFFYIYHKIVDPKNESFGPLKIIPASITAFVILLGIPILIVLIRGGFQLSPINQSAVYFSNNQFVNQAAVNACWNLSYSILEKNYDEKNPFIHQSEQEASQLVKQLYSNNVQPIQVVKAGPVNVVILIWESFTAKSVESMGGKKGITPEFEKLIQEGIFFDNIYASGDRSEKGLISILSGFPAQSIASIMTKNSKVVKLPSLANTFYQQQYKTSFYYGGEPEFANIKSYLIGSNYKKLVTKEHFPKESWNSKWGAHDEVVLQRLFNDLSTTQQPFFSTLFTLSSHEPFEIPISPLLPGKEEETLFLNSLFYTDSCIADFVKKAKTQKWWHNTLIVIVADHGHRLPGSAAATHLPDEFKVPMLWLGGALTKYDTIINVVGSQTDIGNTLLSQLKMNSKLFTYSKNLLTPNQQSFAYYAFNNGFGFITDKGSFVFDNISRNFIHKTPEITEDQVKSGKAYLQHSYQDYLNK